MATALGRLVTDIGLRRPGIRGGRRVPRALHPVAWWIWALALATAVSETTNPVLLLVVLGVLGVVVASRRSDSPWARGFKYYLFLGLAVIAIRVVFRSVFGGDVEDGTTRVFFTLPHVALPGWAAGVQLGGPVTLDGTLAALYDGLRLGTLLCCLGAANVLANPKRALRVLPGALYELGATVVVSFSVAPQLIESVRRVRRARTLRGGAPTGPHALRTVAIPVLADALDRSLRLASAMDSRGYGRTGTASPGSRRVTGALMLAGMCGLCAGVYGMLDGSTPALLGLPALLAGSVLCGIGLAVGSRQVRRTHYRPDPWKWPEWVVTASGLVPAVVLVAAGGTLARALSPSTDPLLWPALPALPTLAVLVAAIPAVAAPPPPRPAKAAERPGAVSSDDGTATRHGVQTLPPAEIPA